jgi:hypothetical protein
MINIISKNSFDIKVENCFRVEIMMDILIYKKTWSLYRIRIKGFYMINLDMMKMHLISRLMNFKRFIKTLLKQEF